MTDQLTQNGKTKIQLGAIDKLPPQAIEEEMAVLGCLLIDSKAAAIVYDTLPVAAFYKKVHRVIYQAIRTLFEKNTEVDYLTVCNELEKMNKLEEVGNAYYVTQLAEAVPSSATIKYYAEIVIGKFNLRQIIETTHIIQESAYYPVDGPQTILENAQKKIMALGNYGKNGFTPWPEIINNTLETLSLYHDKSETVIGIPTGLTELDSKLGGLKDSDLIILAARPSMGKTALAVNNIAYNAAKLGKNVAIFSLEMTKERLAMRVIAAKSDVDHHRMTHGLLSDSDWAKVAQNIGSINEASIHIDDSAASTIMEMRAKARRLQSEHGIGLIIVDYLQLVKVMNSESRQIEIAEISQSLKAFAKEFKIPVLAVSQLSRACEARHDKRPILGDLRESGQIEQDADVVMFLYRDEVYYANSKAKGKSEIIIAKHRNGAIGTIEVGFIPDRVLFVNLEKQQGPNPYEEEKGLF